VGDVDLKVVTETFFRQWGVDWPSFASSFDVFADDCFWEQGSAITRTRDEAVELMTRAHEGAGVERCRVEIRNLWVVDRVVITERVDTICGADGTVLADAPVVGIMEFNDDDRVVRWSEYFDTANLSALAPQA
jgi:limonene-1,2-epoxide hydrolase